MCYGIYTNVDTQRGDIVGIAMLVERRAWRQTLRAWHRYSKSVRALMCGEMSYLKVVHLHFYRNFSLKTVKN